MNVDWLNSKTRSGFRHDMVMPVRVCVALMLGLFLSAQTLADSTLQSGCEVAYPPFCFVNEDGEPDGFSVELFRAALESMGREVTFATGPWAEVRGWLEAGEIDALPLVGRTPEREALFDFTFPYMTLHGAIVIRKDTNGISDFRDLDKKTVGVMKGDNAEEFLRREKRAFTIRTTPTFEDALAGLAEGSFDAVVVQRLVALRLIQANNLQELRVLDRPVEDFDQDFCFAVKEGDSEALALLNEGLAVVMADGTHRRLHAKWFAHMELPPDRALVLGGDHNYPPFEFLDEYGRPAGYNVDLARAVAKAAGLDIRITLGHWTQMRSKLDLGEIDALLGMYYSPERDQDFDFTQAYIVNHCVSVVRTGEGSPPDSVEELRGKRIVVQDGDIMHDYLQAHGLSKETTALDSPEDALRALVAGQYDCALMARMVALYWIEAENWSNLLVSNKPLASADYCFAVPNKHGALLSELSEGLKTVSQTGEHRRIQEKWLGVYGEPPPSFLVALRYSALVLLPLLAVLALVFLWSWALRRKVKRNTCELREAEKALRKQLRYEEAIAKTSTALLKPEIPQQNIANALSVIRQSADVGRVYIFENFADPVDGLCMRQIYETCADGVAPQIGNPVLQHVPYSQGVERWRTLLSEGKPVAGNVADFPVSERSALEPQGIISLLVIPLYIGEHWGGFIGFDEIRAPRQWNGPEVSLLRTSADLIGGYLTRIRAEQALAESEKQYRLLADNTLDVIWTMNMQLEFTYVNQACLGLTGYSPEEWVGTSLPDHCDESHFIQMAGVIQRAAEKGPGHEGVIFETEMRKRDGSPIQVEIHGKVVFDEDGQPIMLQGVTRDISDRKAAEGQRDHLENQLREAQRMEAVGRLAGGVAHDFNNILQSVLTRTSFLLDGSSKGAAAEEDLVGIQEGAEKAAGLVRQLLAFSRRQVLDLKNLDMNEVVADFLKMLRRVIGEDIGLDFIASQRLGVVRADRGQMEQVLMNLCVNARDAMPDGGKIIIETQDCATGSQFADGDYETSQRRYVLLTVTDSGTGMDEETQQHIFEPFFTTKSVGKGTGLGLATVYGIIAQHNGVIRVQSTPGQGTVFKVFLPAADEAPEDVKPEELPERVGGTETILVAEDDHTVRDMLSRVLGQAGYNVITAQNGREAIDLFDADMDAIDLALLDVVMPEKGGREVYDHIKAKKPLMKVLFSSGYSESAIHTRFVLDDGMELIEKPYNPAILLSRIRDILDEEY